MTQDPCAGRDEWMRESNKSNTKTPAQQKADSEATIKAQLTCFTDCPAARREACLKGELALSGHDQWWVYGGYTGSERSRIINNRLFFPLDLLKPLRKLSVDEVLNFVDGATTIKDIADTYGVSWARAHMMLRAALWQFRLDAGDETFVSEHDVPVNIARTVPAA